MNANCSIMPNSPGQCAYKNLEDSTRFPPFVRIVQPSVLESWFAHAQSHACQTLIANHCVFSTLQTPEEKRKRLRSELLRWHPDKFQASFGRNLKSEDADQIMAKVKEISQAINQASK